MKRFAAPLALTLLGACVSEDSPGALDTGSPEPVDLSTCPSVQLTREELQVLLDRVAGTDVQNCWGDIQAELNGFGWFNGTSGDAASRHNIGVFSDIKEACPLDERPMKDINELVALMRGGEFQKVGEISEAGGPHYVKYVLDFSDGRYLVIAFKKSFKGSITEAGTSMTLNIDYVRSKGAALEDLSEENTFWGQRVAFYIYNSEIRKVKCDQWGCPGEFNVFEEVQRWNAYGLEDADRKDFTIYQVMNQNVLPVLKGVLGQNTAPDKLQFDIPADPVALDPQYDPNGQCEPGK